MVAPPSGQGTRAAAAPLPRDPAQSLAAAQLRLVQDLAVVGSDEQRSAAEIHERLEIRDVPGTLQVGYEIEGNEAYPAARKLIEIGQQDSRYKTRRWVVAPLAR